MKINGFNGNTDSLKVINNYKKYNVETGKNKASAVRSDSLELSSEAKDLQKYHNNLRKLPEFRRELVTELKKEIKLGIYKPDAQKIADDMIKEKQLDKLL